MHLIWYLVAGFFALNAVPHLVKGITGQKHMTPFKKVSSAPLNIVWSFINALIALFILGIASGNGGLTPPWDANLANINLLAFLVGGFICAVYLASFWSNPKAKLPWMK